MSVVLEGGCLCGKVRFTASQPPLRTFACHCTFCQRVTGTSFFAESIFPMDAVRFNDGELKRYEHVSEGSQKKVFVHFCPSCSTTVGLGRVGLGLGVGRDEQWVGIDPKLPSPGPKLAPDSR